MRIEEWSHFLVDFERLKAAFCIFPQADLFLYLCLPTHGGIIPACCGLNIKCLLPPQQACVLKAWFLVSRHNHWGRFSKNIDFMDGLFVCGGIIGRGQKVGGGAWLEKACHWGCALKGTSCPGPSLYLLFASWLPKTGQLSLAMPFLYTVFIWP